MELVIVRDPDPQSKLPYLMRVPLGEGLVFRTSGTWPRTISPTATSPPPTPADSVDLSAVLGADPMLATAPDQPAPSTAEVRAWARQAGLPVPDRGRLQPTVWQAWREAHRNE